MIKWKFFQVQSQQCGSRLNANTIHIHIYIYKLWYLDLYSYEMIWVLNFTKLGPVCAFYLWTIHGFCVIQLSGFEDSSKEAKPGKPWLILVVSIFVMVCYFHHSVGFFSWCLTVVCLPLNPPTLSIFGKWHRFLWLKPTTRFLDVLNTANLSADADIEDSLEARMHQKEDTLRDNFVSDYGSKPWSPSGYPKIADLFPQFMGTGKNRFWPVPKSWSTQFSVRVI